MELIIINSEKNGVWDKYEEKAREEDALILCIKLHKSQPNAKLRSSGWIQTKITKAEGNELKPESLAQLSGLNPGKKKKSVGKTQTNK